MAYARRGVISNEMLFTQSRVLHARLRDHYRGELELQDDRRHNNAPPLMDETRVALMFTAEQFHAQVFDAFQANPLSSLLSLAWTICSTSFSISPKMTEHEYLAVWSPFFCVVNVLSYLENKLANRTAPTTTRPFDVQDLRLMDRQFVDSVRATLKLEPDARKELTRQRLSSDFMEQLLTNTPFGTYQISDVATPAHGAASVGSDAEWTYGAKRYTYVRSPVNVLDRERYFALYARHETANRVRVQAESELRQRFAAYHQLYGLNINVWMIPTHEKNQDGSRALIWQMNKSALVWILYHALAALVAVADDQRITADFIVTVRSMDKFIECGMCLHHWKTRYAPLWDLVYEEYKQLNEQGAFHDTTNASHYPRSMDVDLRLLATHNDVQTSIDPRLRLTSAAVHALREDYLNLARSLVMAVAARPPSAAAPAHTPLKPDQFDCAVYKMERERLDVCVQPSELFARSLKTSLRFTCDSRRERVKQALLALEWDRMNCQ